MSRKPFLRAVKPSLIVNLWGTLGEQTRISSLFTSAEDLNATMAYGFTPHANIARTLSSFFIPATSFEGSMIQQEMVARR